ncbi:hypothetical protein PINS_up007851 [Pythium insidiosum]|nr:hypothetical protein PINS_up007851 [Pythium insidiosum]
MTATRSAPTLNTTTTATTRKRPYRARLSCTSLYADFFPACLAFLDMASMANCALVCKDWHRGLQDPFVWEQFYGLSWRHGQLFPKQLAALEPQETGSVALQLRRACMQRLRVPLSISTRAQTWIRPNGSVFVLNDSLRRSMDSGSTESVRSRDALSPLAVVHALTGRRVCYFEVSMTGCGSIGLASVSNPNERATYGFTSSHHVGWAPVSYGFHGDNGNLYFNDGSAPIGGVELHYGPVWGDQTPQVCRKTPAAPVVVGCGWDMDLGQLFFTLNGRWLGIAPVAIDAKREFAAAVTLHRLGDYAELNLGRSAFVFDLEAFVVGAA